MRIKDKNILNTDIRVKQYIYIHHSKQQCIYSQDRKSFPFSDLESASAAAAKRHISLRGRVHLVYTEWQIYLTLSINEMPPGFLMERQLKNILL